ncbi:MAG: hypothetical protein IKN54_07265 [Lachnospiraceae bacterium]|nr:hypothetical protein [Lachnospiraceae bacterium]
MLRKIDRMHQLFGISEQHKCKDCEHLIRETYRGRNYFKCSVYGQSNSEATDWRLSYTACGLHNRPYDGDMEIISIRPAKEPDKPLEGQIGIFDL